MIFNNKIEIYFFFFFQAEDGIRDKLVTGVQTCALPISMGSWASWTLPSAPTMGCPRNRVNSTRTIGSSVLVTVATPRVLFRDTAAASARVGCHARPSTCATICGKRGRVKWLSTPIRPFVLGDRDGSRGTGAVDFAGLSGLLTLPPRLAPAGFESARETWLVFSPTPA